MVKLWMKFILKFITPYGCSPSAIPLWISRLNHETLNHPMKDDIIIITIPCQPYKVFNSLWHLIRVQFYMNFAQVCIDDRLAGQLSHLSQLSTLYFILLGLLIEHVPTDGSLSRGSYLLQIFRIGWLPLSEEIKPIF